MQLPTAAGGMLQSWWACLARYLSSPAILGDSIDSPTSCYLPLQLPGQSPHR